MLKRYTELNGWDIYREWTKQDQPESYSVRRPMGTRPVGRPRQRWQEDVMEDLKKLKVEKKLEGRIGKLGETCLRRRKPTKGCSVKWWWWW
jgi:hypothetical protein